MKEFMANMAKPVTSIPLISPDELSKELSKLTRKLTDKRDAPGTSDYHKSLLNSMAQETFVYTMLLSTNCLNSRGLEFISEWPKRVDDRLKPFTSLAWC